jgi:hypothetical protein
MSEKSPILNNGAFGSLKASTINDTDGKIK